MSTMQTKGKKTKGKQRIEMKKVEDYEDRMTTFSKRKTGIYKKLNEITTMCSVDAAFLVFTEARNPYTFAHPSMEKVADRLMNPLDQGKNDDTTGALIQTYENQKIVELEKKHAVLVEELGIEKEKEKVLKESINEDELARMWWNTSLKDLSMEALEQSHEVLTELYNRLYDMTLSKLEKEREASSSH